MAAVWHPIGASVCKTGGVTTAPVVSGWWLQGGSFCASREAHPPYRAQVLRTLGNHPAESHCSQLPLLGVCFRGRAKARHGGMCGGQERETGTNWSWGGARPLVTPSHPLIPQLAPQEFGGRGVTSPAIAATAAPVTPRVGRVPAPLACSPHTAFNPAPLAAMALPASSAASATGHPVTPRPGPASAPQRELGPGM